MNPFDYVWENVTALSQLPSQMTTRLWPDMWVKFCFEIPSDCW